MKTAGNHLICFGLALASAWGTFHAASADSLENLGTRDAKIRERYEQILERNPFQKRAFDQVFESYLHWEGVDAWVEKLSFRLADAESKGAAAILLGQIYARQFKTAEAIETLQGVRQTANNAAAPATGFTASPEFNRLLGTLYYRQGENQKGISLLTQALADLSDLEERSQVSRILGNLFLREGNTEQAVEVWQQIAAQSPKDIFAQIELGAIYEENRLWEEAVAVYQRIASLSEQEPYRRCRALRSIGNCQLRAERFPEAIAAYEAALELVSPGNWLFEDVKLRLVQVYEDMGDLAGLVEYVSARLKQNPADIEFRDLLAETHLRMNRLDKAESEYLAILERNPRHAPTFEKLIALYHRLQQPEKRTDSFEKLIQLFPNDSDYLRRLGESHWQNGDVELAKQTWERLLSPQRTDKPGQSQTSTAGQWAELAAWYELYEFPEDAIRCYRQALASSQKSAGAKDTTTNKEWSFRLAELLFATGENSQAIAVWESTLRTNGASGDEYAEVASILDAHQQTEKAEELWKIAVKKSPKNLDFSLQLARNLMRQEKFEEAAAIFGSLADQTENVYFQNRGESGRLDAWSQLGILPEKQAKWEKELLENPDSIPVLSRLAKLYQHAGQRESALSLLEKRTQLQPDNGDFRRDLIRAYRANRFINKAIEELLQIAAEDKTRARVYHQELLDIYLALDLRDEAIATAEKIVELAPADAESRIDLAQVYTLYQRPEEGLQQYRYALRLKPNEPDYHRQHGEALKQQKRWGEAQIAFQKMLDTAGDDGVRLSAIAQLAQIHQLQNTADELIADFTRRRRNTPKKLSAYKELAHIYQETGHPTKSLAVLEEGLQNVEDKVPALQSLVRAAYQAHDFLKVIGYYEELIAHRGKPSAYEYEKLGNIYAQIGDLAKARETWKQMVEDYSQSVAGEKASASQDPKAYDRLADIFQRENLPNEALEYKRQAVDLDESNYQRRWEYAQMLAENERSIEAIEQLQKLLQLGDRQQTFSAETKKKTARQRRQSAPAPPQYFAPYMSPYGPFPFPSGVRHVSYHVSIPYGQPYYGGSLQGTFQEIRPQVIYFMAALSQNSSSEDVLIEQFVKTAEDQPKNTQAKRDLMLIYESCRRIDDALNMAEEILQLAPNDAALIQQTAFYYAGRRELGKASSLLEKLAATQPQYRNQARQTLIPLYFQNQESEKAIALTKQMLEENPNDVQPLLTLTGLMQQRGQLDEVIALYEKAQSKAQGNTASFFSAGLAHLYAQKGDKDKAKDLYAKMLVADSAPAGFSLRRPGVELYVPSPRSASSPRYYGGGVFRNLPPTLIGSIDYQKAEAMRQLQTLSEDGDLPLQPLINQAKQLRSAKSRDAKDKAWLSAKLLIASYLADSKLEDAQRWLEEIKDAAADRVEWFNLALHIAESRDDCDAMMQLYDQAERRFSSQARKILSAKASVSIRCERYEEAAAYIRQMIQRRFSPKELVVAIRPLSNAGENERAKELLEEHLSGISRNGEALALLAHIYADEENYERAIALARESWDRSSHGGSSRSYRYRSYSPGVVSSAITRSAGGLLQNLHHYYVQAGRSEELIQEFAERLAKQPGSVRLHENLAALYAFNNQNDKAIEIYKTLIQKRPHLVQAKQQLARFYSETGNFDKSASIYEQLLKTHPNIYRQVSWELRNLYRRSGQGKQILKIEENLAKRMRDPNQLQQLANRFQQSGELEKAAELYEKAIKLSPGHTWLHRQLADVYLKLGKHEDAVGLYKNWLASPFARAQGAMDGYTLQHLAGVYASTGRLNELKEINREFIEKDTNDPLSSSLTAQIAIFEKRFDDAIEHLTKAVNTGQSPYAFSDLLDIAEVTGRINDALEGVQEPMLQQSHYDKGHLAKIYMAKGDLARGKKLYKEWIEEQVGFGGPVWHFMRQAVNTFGEYDLWDEVEALVRKHSPNSKRQRSSRPPFYEQREFNQIVAEVYVQHNQLQDIVNETLDKETYTDADAELFLAIANQYRRNYFDRSESRREAFLSRVVARSPGNATRLVSELIQIHFRNNNPEKAAELSRQLVEEEPDNLSHRRLYADALNRNKQPEKAAELARQLMKEEPDNLSHRRLYADAMFNAGKQSPALATLSSWAIEKETDKRYHFLADYQERAGKHAEARASLLKAIELADASRKTAAELQLARFDAKRGNPEAAKQAYAKQFEQRADAPTFKQYFDFLRENNYLEEARQLFLKHKDRGYLDTYEMDEVFALFTDSEDFDTLIDIAWDHFRYTENHMRRSFFYDIEPDFRNPDSLNMKAKQKRLLDGLRKRAEAEEPPNQEILSLLAQAYAEAKLQEPVGELYEQLRRQNPFNQEYVLNRARWLAKNGQADEAFALIERLPPALTLYQEADNQVQVIGFYLKHQAPKRAQAAVDKLLAWRGDGDVEIEIGNLFFNEEQYEKALAHYENSLKKYQKDKRLREQLFANMGKCYALQGRQEDALKAFEKFGIQNNRHRSLSGWLMSKKLYETAVAWLESSRKTAPLSYEHIRDLAECYLHLEKPQKALVVYQKHWDQSNERNRSRVQRDFSSLIRRHSNLQEILDQAETHPLIDQARKDRNVPSMPFPPPPERRITDPIHFPLGIPKEIRERIIRSSFRRSASPPPVPGEIVIESKPTTPKIDAEVLKHFQENKDILLAEPHRLEALFKLASEETAAQLIEAINDSVSSKSRQAYYRVLAAHFQGKSELAAQELANLAKNPDLSAEPLKHLVSICQTAGQRETALAFLNRLADGDYDENHKQYALQKLPELQLEAGNLSGALSNFAKLLPDRQQKGHEFLQALYYASTNQQKLPAFRSALETLIAGQPDLPSISMLVGLYREIHEKLGIQPEPFSLRPEQREESSPLSAMIQSWQIAGPYSLHISSKPPADPAAWTKHIGPKDTFGFIYLDELFDLKKRRANFGDFRASIDQLEESMMAELDELGEFDEPPLDEAAFFYFDFLHELVEDPSLDSYFDFIEFLEMDLEMESGNPLLDFEEDTTFDSILSSKGNQSIGKSAYARAALMSPDVRSIALAFESDDPGMVWLNGQAIHLFPVDSSESPNRAQASLKAGENILTVRIDNLRGSWFFNAQIVENGGDIRIQLPSANSQQKADNTTTP